MRHELEGCSYVELEKVELFCLDLIYICGDEQWNLILFWGLGFVDVLYFLTSIFLLFVQT